MTVQTTRQKRVYIPVNFNAEDHLPPGLKKHKDKANYLVGRIIAGAVFGQADERGYVNLKVEYLRKVMGRRLERPVRFALISAGVIESDRHFVETEKATGYRLSPRYRQAETTPINYEDKALVRRVRQLEDQKPMIDVHRHLLGYLERLELDGRRARDIIDALPVDGDRRAAIGTSVRMMEDGDVGATVCRFGRFHSNLTNLKSDLRGCLTFEGHQLAEVDVACSQPLILGLVLSSYREQGGRIAIPNAKSLYIDLDLDVIDHHFVPTFDLTQSPESTFTLPTITMDHSIQDQDRTSFRARRLKDDEQEYLRLTEAGRLYEYLMSQGGEKWTRSQTKEGLFYTLYSHNQSGSVIEADEQRREVRERNEAIKALFAKNFPSVAAVVHELKRKDYRHLAQHMQRLESSIIINTVCRRLMAETPHIPVFTIHDSILTVPQHRQHVERLVRQTFQRLGVRPTLKITDYSTTHSPGHEAAAGRVELCL